MPEDFIPRSFFLRTLRAWWMVVVLMLLGGLIGFLIHQNTPSVYESQASIAFAFDLARTGAMQVSEEDIAMGAAGTILYTAPVPDQVIADARAKNIRLESYPQWSKISLERKNYLWVLRIRFTNPQDAAALTNIWIERAYASLAEAGKHAEQAESLRRSLEGMESCMQQMAVTEPAAAQCAWSSLPDLQREMKSLSDRHQQEKAAARSLIPALNFSLAEKAQVNPQPVIYDRNTLVLAGALIGLLAAIGLVASGLVDRLLRRFSR